MNTVMLEQRSVPLGGKGVLFFFRMLVEIFNLLLLQSPVQNPVVGCALGFWNCDLPDDAFTI